MFCMGVFHTYEYLSRERQTFATGPIFVFESKKIFAMGHNFEGLLTWPNEDDWMNLTESWQQQTLIIEIDWNWNRQTFWYRQTLTLCPGSS